jgi:hypothetical protein
VLTVDVCLLLQPALEEKAGEVCRPSFSEQSERAKKVFCSLVGKLFLDASYSPNRDYATVMGKIVRSFLNAWSKCPAEENEGQLLAEVQCFGHLCRQIGPTIDLTNRETLEQYFSGAVKKHILSLKLAGSVRSSLLDLSLERAAGWREEASRRGLGVGPTSEPGPPAVFSQDTPTHSANGQRVVQPLPVNGSLCRAPPPATDHNHLPSPTVVHHRHPPAMTNTLPQTAAQPQQMPQFHPSYSTSRPQSVLPEYSGSSQPPWPGC